MKKFELEEQLELYKVLLQQQSDTINRLWDRIDNQGYNLSIVKNELQELKKDAVNLRLRLNFYRRKRLTDQTKEAEIEKAFHEFAKDERTDN